jgi:hypothetical protein
VVRAFDLDAGPGSSNTIGSWIAEFLRAKGAQGNFPPLGSGAYVISNRRIADATSGWKWVPYNGSNPHTKHTHLSVARSQSGFDYQGSWGISGSVPTVKDIAGETLQLGSRGQDVQELQQVLNSWYPSLPQLNEDGEFGKLTEERVKYFQTRAGLVSDGVVGPKTKAILNI